MSTAGSLFASLDQGTMAAPAIKTETGDVASETRADHRIATTSRA